MKKTQHVIEIGDGLSLAEIKSAIKDDKVLIDLLIGDISRHDERATVLDNTFSIDKIEKLKCGLYSIEFSYLWEAHYGCRDMCQVESCHDSIEFSFLNGKIVFDIPSEVETRSADGEF